MPTDVLTPPVAPTQSAAGPARNGASSLPLHAAWAKLGHRVPLRARYGNFIGGQFVEPVGGRYFSNPSPITGHDFCEIARSGAEDVERALDAAHAAKDAWGRASLAERSRLLNRIADRMEEKPPPARPGRHH